MVVNEDQGTAIGTDSSQALSTDGKEDTWFMSSIIINVIFNKALHDYVMHIYTVCIRIPDI